MTRRGDETAHVLDSILLLRLKHYFCWRAMDPLLDLDLPSFDRHFQFDGRKPVTSYTSEQRFGINSCSLRSSILNRATPNLILDSLFDFLIEDLGPLQSN